jgi:dTDP-4-dehydrorhamnose 3,5-epimerase
VLSESALFSYKCTELYHPETEFSIAWNDPTIGINWPFEAPLLSNRDAEARCLRKLPFERLPRWRT